MALQSNRSMYPQKEPDAFDKNLRERYYNETERPEGDLPDRSLDEQALGDELSEVERQLEDQASQRKRLDVIDRLAASLVVKRNKAIVARASCGIEQIWREDELAYEGHDESSLRTRMVDYATESAPVKRSKKEDRRSRVLVNLVRPKCETAESRFSDILLPTDDKNWGLKHTPVPELDEAALDETGIAPKGHPDDPYVDDQGKQITRADLALMDLMDAEKKMKSMESEINDQLNECDFNGECRKVIQDGVRVGTGILKGPTTRRQMRKRWRKVQGEDRTVRVLDVNEDLRPGSIRKDYWDVFPDPECKDDISRAAYIWDREAILPRELRDLARLEGQGYLPDQIELVLMEEPRRTTIAAEKNNQYVVRYNTVEAGNNYEKWEYNGECNRDDLEALGCDCSAARTASVSACLIMVNDRPIRAELNSLDTGELPFDFFVWSKRSAVPWGIGVARQMAWQQRVIIAAWRMMMDNAGDSAGANIVIGQGIEPADGIWDFGGKKIWRDTDGDMDLSKKFQQWLIQTNQADYQAIIEMALRFADMETSVPMIFQGEQGKRESRIPETLGQTLIMVDSQNVGVRGRVKLWDDRITRPHLTRYYDWNMQYGEDDSIKGDYDVDARGTSVLYERDQQGRSIEEIMPLREDDELADMVDWPKALKQFLAARNLNIILPEEKIAENRKKREEAQPPEDPQLQVAKVRAEGELQKEQMRQQAEQQKMQVEADQQLIQWQHERDLALLNREMKIMELSASSGIALDKIKAQLSEVAMKLNTQVALATDKNVKPAEQVATPIAEPAPRAAPGHAFQD